MAAAASAPARRDFSKGTLLRETRSREGRERGRTTTQREWVERGSGMVGACRAAIDSFLPPEPASLLSLSVSLHLSVPTLGWLFVRSLSAPSSRYCHSKHLFALASPATTPYYNKTAPRLFYFSRFIFFLLFFFIRVYTASLLSLLCYSPVLFFTLSIRRFPGMQLQLCIYLRDMTGVHSGSKNHLLQRNVRSRLTKQVFDGSKGITHWSNNRPLNRALLHLLSRLFRSIKQTFVLLVVALNLVIQSVWFSQWTIL